MTVVLEPGKRSRKEAVMFLRTPTIENVRSIEHPEIPFNNEDDATRPWTIFLGEKGTRKSTLLQCVALLLGK